MMAMQKELATWVMAYSDAVDALCTSMLLLSVLQYLCLVSALSIKSRLVISPLPGKPSVYVCCEEQMDNVMVVVIHAIKS